MHSWNLKDNKIRRRNNINKQFFQLKNKQLTKNEQIYHLMKIENILTSIINYEKCH